MYRPPCSAFYRVGLPHARGASMVCSRPARVRSGGAPSLGERMWGHRPESLAGRQSLGRLRLRFGHFAQLVIDVGRFRLVELGEVLTWREGLLRTCWPIATERSRVLPVVWPTSTKSRRCWPTPLRCWPTPGDVRALWAAVAHLKKFGRSPSRCMFDPRLHSRPSAPSRSMYPLGKGGQRMSDLEGASSLKESPAFLASNLKHTLSTQATQSLGETRQVCRSLSDGIDN